MINDQEYITTKLKKTLEKMIILSAPRLNNLIAMVIGIICSQSVVLSKISQELKDNYSLGTEESKIKRLQRFLSNEAINPEKLYEFFTKAGHAVSCFFLPIYKEFFHLRQIDRAFFVCYHNNN